MYKHTFYNSRTHAKLYLDSNGDIMQKKHMQKPINSENHSPKDNLAIELVKELTESLEKSSVKDLNLTLKKLNYLCLHFDPFDFLNRDNESENILKEFDLEQFSNNPFDFTKIILKLIDTIETLKSSKTRRAH